MYKVFIDRVKKFEDIRNGAGLDVFFGVIVFVLKVKIDDRVINQIGTDTWKVADNGDALALEVIRRSNTREEQYLTKRANLMLGKSSLCCYSKYLHEENE